MARLSRNRVLKKKSVRYTNAEIKALPTLGKVLIVPPLNGVLQVPVSISMYFKRVGNYTNIGAHAQFFFNEAFADLLDENSNDHAHVSAFFAAGNDMVWLPGITGVGNPATYFQGANEGINFEFPNLDVNDVDLGALTGGNAGNKLFIHVYYVEIDIS